LFQDVAGHRPHLRQRHTHYPTPVKMRIRILFRLYNARVGECQWDRDVWCQFSKLDKSVAEASYSAACEASSAFLETRPRLTLTAYTGCRPGVNSSSSAIIPNNNTEELSCGCFKIGASLSTERQGGTERHCCHDREPRRKLRHHRQVGRAER